MQVELSEKTQQLVNQLFLDGDRQLVFGLLEKECGNNLPLLEKSNPIDLERFRFAVLKLCTGNFEKLEQQVQLAKNDWRDLLVSAGFANDIEEHRKWFLSFTKGQ